MQVLLLAASAYAPFDLHIRVLFATDQIAGEKMAVVWKYDRTVEVYLWSGCTMTELLTLMIEGLAIAITGDEGRGPAYCDMRDNIRAAYCAMRE